MPRFGSAVWESLRTPAGARWRNIALGCLAVGIGAAIWSHAIRSWPHIGYDFRAYLTGAQLIATGQNPFHALVSQTGNNGFQAQGYVYPPLLGVLLAAPLRLGLSHYVVWMLWTLVNVFSVIWMGRELNLAFRGKHDWPMTLVFATASLVPAVAIYDLYLGQADLLMASLAVGACGLWLRKNPWAGLVLGAAIAIKPIMGLLLLVWLWKGDWRAALRGALAATALVALPFGIVGLQAFQDYVTFFIHWNAFGADAQYINQSPYGMLLRMFTRNPYTHPLEVAPWLVMPLRYLSTLVVAGFWLWVVPRRATADRALAMGECLLAMPLILLISPLSEDIHFCLLIPTLFGLSWLAWDRGLWRGSGGRIGQVSAWALWLTLAL